MELNKIEKLHRLEFYKKQRLWTNKMDAQELNKSDKDDPPKDGTENTRSEPQLHSKENNYDPVDQVEGNLVPNTITQVEPEFVLYPSTATSSTAAGDPCVMVRPNISSRLELFVRLSKLETELNCKQMEQIDALQDTELNSKQIEQIDALQDTELNSKQIEQIDALQDTELNSKQIEQIDALQDTELNSKQIEQIDALQDTELNSKQIEQIDALQDTELNSKQIEQIDALQDTELNSKQIEQIDALQDTELNSKQIEQIDALQDTELNSKQIEQIDALQDTELNSKQIEQIDALQDTELNSKQIEQIDALQDDNSQVTMAVPEPIPVQMDEHSNSGSSGGRVSELNIAMLKLHSQDEMDGMDELAGETSVSFNTSIKSDRDLGEFGCSMRGESSQYEHELIGDETHNNWVWMFEEVCAEYGYDTSFRPTLLDDSMDREYISFMRGIHDAPHSSTSDLSYTPCKIIRSELVTRYRLAEMSPQQLASNIFHVYKLWMMMVNENTQRTIEKLKKPLASFEDDPFQPGMRSRTHGRPPHPRLNRSF